MSVAKVRVPDTFPNSQFECPCGGERFAYGHLSEGSSAGPWYCGNCMVGWFPKVVGGVVTIKDRGFRMREVRARLELKPQEKSVFFEVKARIFTENGQKPTLNDAGDSHYFYEEHQCASNLMRDVIKVSAGDDDDPHGLLDFDTLIDKHPDERP